MRLIVGVDGTDKGMDAFEEAIEQADDAEALTVAIYSASEDTATETVEEMVRSHLEEYSIGAEIEVLENDPGSQLVELADLGEYDQIFLPGGRESPLGKITLDSTIEFVLLNARTSVTLIR